MKRIAGNTATALYNDMRKRRAGVEENSEEGNRTVEGSGQKEQEETEKHLNMGTWNLRGVYEEGAIINLVMEMNKYNMHIVAVQETHLKGNNIQKIANYTFFTSGSDSRRYGVGFLINEVIQEKVKHFEPKSDRLCIIRIEGKDRMMTIINMHAPTEEKEDEIKDKHYEELESVIERIPNQDVIVLIGDANAKVGREDIYKSITGGESKHAESNDNGLRLISFAIEQKMKIVSTHFKRKNIYKGTWTIPGRNETNQIDHILIKEEFAQLITNVRTCRGAEADSDHFLVRAKLRFGKLEKRKQMRCLKTRHRMEDLQNDEIARNYRKCINEAYSSDMGQNVDDVEGKWEKIEMSVKEATKTSLPKRRIHKKRSWMNKECKDELREKARLRQKMLQSQTESSIKKYNEQRKKAKQVCRARKRKFMEDEVKEIEIKYRRKEVRNFYKEVKDIRKGYQTRAVFYKDKEGNLLGKEEEILRRFKEYFEGLLKVGGEAKLVESQQELPSDEEGILVPSMKEVEEVLYAMKNNKSPGENGITAENLKYGGGILKSKIYELVKEIWNTEVMPQKWNKAIIIPLFKKGDVADCGNYRGIALLDVTYKIIATLVKKRLEIYAETLLGEYQAGFRKNRSTSDQIYMLKQILIGCYEYEIPTHMMFIDFKAAYDSVDRKKLVEILREFKIPEKVARLVTMTLRDTTCAVKVNGKISEEFEVRRGLRQGDPLSTVLFNIALEKVIRASGINRRGTLFNRSHQCLAYADDILLIARSRRELELVTRKLVEAASCIGLEVNKEKSKYMKLGRTRETNGGIFTVRMENQEIMEFEEVENYMYLGVLIDKKCEEETEVNLRIAKSNRCAGGLNRILRAKNISRKIKIRIYKTVLRPTLIYGCEAWTMNKKIQEKLSIWERKILRRIFGGRNVDGTWERRSNEEVYEMFGEPLVCQIIKARRLQWLGHLERLGTDRLVKNCGWTIPEGTRKRGRPRRKWREAVEEDLEEMGIENWRKAAGNRKEWKNIIKLWA